MKVIFRLVESVYLQSHPLLGGMVPSRDFVTMRCIEEHRDGTLSVYGKAAPEGHVAEQTGVIRGTMIMTSTIVRWLGDARGEDGQCEADITTLTDPGGSMPKWLINKALTSTLKGAHTSLKGYMEKQTGEVRFAAHYEDLAATPTGR